MTSYRPDPKILTLGAEFYDPVEAARFPNCIAAKLTMNFKNEDFMIPEFDFSAFADSAGNIFYWDLDE